MFPSRFQRFDDVADPAASMPRMAGLRAVLAKSGLDGFIVPRADAHQNEYVRPCDERLAWLTGFGGSAGTAVVLSDTAAIFVDGRYTLQVRDQVDVGLLTPFDSATITPGSWLAKQAKANARIGYDPWLHTPAQIDALEKTVSGKGIGLVPVADNPVDQVWTDRPSAQDAPVVLHPDRLAGESAAKKIARIEAACPRGVLLTDPHDVAWAFNIRGGDVAHTPLPISFALIVKGERPRLYVSGTKLSNAVRDALEQMADVVEPARLESDLAALGKKGERLTFDSATAAQKLVAQFRDAGGVAALEASPVSLMKAAKNKTELRGARAAHLRDGAALTEFLAWFAKEAPSRTLTEISAAQALEHFRTKTGKLKEISFPTISAFGPHAAIPHYRVTDQTNLRIGKGIFLIDSGAQYQDGTTDVTRTLCVGVPTRAMRECNTRVLKGHIAIARAVFPKGTTGAQIDAFARQHLWKAGLDFDHGTGHGIGSYLSVHEGPQRIAKVGGVALLPGMILSNEPGYYRAGAFGIRIENLLIVEERVIAGAERAMLGFETITLAPFERSLIDVRMLTREEIVWVDTYHARVRAMLLPKVSVATARWLRDATRKL